MVLVHSAGGWRGRDESAGPMWYFDDGKLVRDATTPGTAGHHGARLPFQVETRAPENPIMKGLPPVLVKSLCCVMPGCSRVRSL